MDRLRDAIFQKSAGIFLWVSLVVSQLNEVFNNDGRMNAIWKRLRGIPIAAKEISVSDGDLPLYGLFRDVITKDTRNIPDLVRLIQLIFCARRSLRPEEIFVALHRSYHEPFDAEKVKPDILSKHVLAISKGLAEVTRAKEPTVQFIHETVREFLRDGGLPTISKQLLYGDGNDVLKITCLDQIKALDSVAEHSELLADYHKWTSFRSEQDKKINHKKRKEFQEQVSRTFPFLEYATQHILFHADSAAAQGMPQRLFLDSFPRSLWVPLHNLFEPANSKRFGKADTPMLYILAGLGLNDLVRIATNQRNYAAMCQNEQCQTALHNAIYSGHFDTAWVLVGLDPRDRSLRLDDPKLMLSWCHETLLKAILDADDVEILRRVTQDVGVAHLQRDAAWAQGEKGLGLILSECRSTAMIDCLAELSLLPNMSSTEEDTQNGANCCGSISPTSNLFFIRRAIEREPKLLTGRMWNGKRMLDYATEKRFSPLVTLYFELIHSRGLATHNEWVCCAAIDGWLVGMKEAYSHGADLDYQDESGRTVLHRMFTGNCFKSASYHKQRDMCAVLQYLLLKSPKLGTFVDKDGYTALDRFRNDLCGYDALKPEDTWYKHALETFARTGAMARTSFTSKDHECPWVVIPWISVQFAMQLAGQKQYTDLDARDSLGRTALSWCFWSRAGATSDEFYRNKAASLNGSDEFYRNEAASLKGIDLLKFPQVDVNSRDNWGRTILEHLIRHPDPHALYIEDLTVAFLKSSALDVNLETSDRHSPLDLVVSLYSTCMLPLEVCGIHPEWRLRVLERRCLHRTAQLLLETKRVDISEQKRCLASAPGDLRDLILESIRKVEPDYHWQTVSDGSQEENPYDGID